MAGRTIVDLSLYKAQIITWFQDENKTAQEIVSGAFVLEFVDLNSRDMVCVAQTPPIVYKVMSRLNNVHL